MKITKTYSLSEKTLEKDIGKFMRDAKKGAYQYDYKYGQEGLKLIKAYFRMIEEEFKTFMIAHNHFLNADQINFLRTLQTVFMKKKHIEFKDFFEPPFVNIPNAPTPLFSDATLDELVTLCNKLEKEVFA